MQDTVYFVELTVPWEDAVQEAFEKKIYSEKKYSELTAEAGQKSWSGKIYQVDIFILYYFYLVVIISVHRYPAF